MKTSTLVLTRKVLFILVLTIVLPIFAFAQSTSDDTAVAVAAGQQLFQKLGAKQVSCEQLSESDYEHLGEYFMSQMMGSSHESMNTIIKNRLGESGEEQMHVAMGKRLSGCDTQAAYPAGLQGFAPMMGGGMMGSGSNYYGSNNGTSMMNGYGWGGLAMGLGGIWLLFNILWWVVVVAATIFLARWVFGGSGRWGSRASVLDILKDRYAKGEIDKEEFESKKKDLTS